MARKAKKTLTKVTKDIQLDNVSIQDMAAIAITSSEETKLGLQQYLISGFITIVLMVQLRLTQVEQKAEYFDKLPPYKYYKNVGIQGVMGRTIGFLSALYKTSPVIPNLNSETITSLALALH